MLVTRIVSSSLPANYLCTFYLQSSWVLVTLSSLHTNRVPAIMYVGLSREPPGSPSCGHVHEDPAYPLAAILKVELKRVGFRDLIKTSAVPGLSFFFFGSNHPLQCQSSLLPQRARSFPPSLHTVHAYTHTHTHPLFSSPPPPHSLTLSRSRARTHTHSL